MSLINSLERPQQRREIICDGDSWTFGCEIVDPELAKKHDSSTHPGAYDFEPANDDYRTARIFPTYLAEILDADVTNLSWPADDNGTILRRTIDYISNKYIANNLRTDNLFVIIGWSSPERNSFWYKDENLSMPFRLWPQVPHFDAAAQSKIWDLYVAYMWYPEEYIRRFIFDVVQLQNFCKAHNIKWMCFNSFYQVPFTQVEEWHDLDIRKELEKLTGKQAGYQYQSSKDRLKRKSSMNDYTALWDTVDPIRFYKKDQPCSTFKSYVEHPDTNVKKVFCGWHPSPESHKAWAKEIANYITKHNLL
jgi:hypothetical protein